MDDCIKTLMDPEIQKKLFGESKVPEEAIRRMVQDIQWIKENSLKDPTLGSFKSRLNNYVADQKIQASVKKAVRANDRRIWKQMKTFSMQEAYYGDPVEGVKSMMSGSIKLGIGSRDSAYGRIANIHDWHMNKLYGGLESAKVREVVASGQLDGEIRSAWSALASGQEMPKVSEEAGKAAKVFHDVYKSLLVASRNAGIPVRELGGYTGAQLENIPKLRETTFEDWSKKVREFGIDKEKTFGANAGDTKAEERILKQIYESKKFGYESADSKMPKMDDEVRQGSSYSTKLSEKRSLRLLNHESETKYMAEYGRGNMLETASYDIARKSRMIGMVEKFGSNPEKMISDHIDRMVSIFKRDGRPDLALKLERGKTDINNVMFEMTNRAQIPGLNTIANIGESIRAMNSVSKLGWSGVMSLPNLAVSASTLRSFTGRGFLESMAHIGIDWVKTFAPENRAIMAKRAGYFIDDINRGNFAPEGAWDQAKGIGHRLMSAQFKINGMNLVNQMQHAFAHWFMSDVGDAVKGDWAAVDSQMKAGLMSVGITDKDFPILKHAVEVTADGREMVTVEGIENLDKSIVRARAQEVGLSAERYIADLRGKYYSAIIHGGTDATTSSTFRERAFISRGTYKGTASGEALRLLGQFKQFLVQAANIAIKTANMKPDEAKLARGILVSAKPDAFELAKLIAGSTAMGYMGLLMKEGIMSGADKALDATFGVESLRHKQDLNPFHPQTILNAMNRGGAMGIYMDFLLSDPKFSGAETVLGPTFGQLFGPVQKEVGLLRDDLINSGRDGVNKKSMREATVGAATIIKNNIPFAQFPIMKQALDYGINNVLQESLSHGYVERRKLRLMSEEAKRGR